MSSAFGTTFIASLSFVDRPLLVVMATFVFFVAPIAGSAGVVLIFDGLTRRTVKGFACLACGYDVTDRVLAVGVERVGVMEAATVRVGGEASGEAAAAAGAAGSVVAASPDGVAVRCPECGADLTRSRTVMTGHLSISRGRVGLGIGLAVGAVVSVAVFAVVVAP